MVFENNVEALAAQQPSEDPMCYICGEEMIPFHRFDSVYSDKGSETDPTMTTWLERCLKRCHEPCLGKRMLEQCRNAGHCAGRETCDCEPRCPDCRKAMSQLAGHSARKAAENSTWFEMPELDRRYQALQEFERRQQMRRARVAEEEEKRRQEGTDKMLQLKPLAASSEDSWNARRERQKQHRKFERQEHDKKTGELLGKLRLVTQRFNEDPSRSQRH